MKGSTTVLTLLGLGIAGIWLASYEAERGTDPQAPAIPSALLTSRGQTIALRQAGVVIWDGPGMKSSAMTIHCANGGVAYGFMAGMPIALNGHSMTAGRGGSIQLANGDRRSVVSADHGALVGIGVITSAADPIIYNRKTDEGLSIATSSCS